LRVYLRKIAISFLILALASAIGTGIIFIIFGRDLPSLEQLEKPPVGLASTVYSADGHILKRFYIQRRVFVPYEMIPQHLIDAVISVEDRRFWDHWGIDMRRLFKAAFINLRAGRIVQGASTITQQLSRNLFLTLKVTFRRKIREALTAIRIERTYTKREILEMYLNQVYFGHGAYGIESAAQTFFGKHAEELNLEECALLVAMLPSPSYYSPIAHPERAIRRRNLVLDIMASSGKISKEEAEAAKSKELGAKLRGEEGEAPYFVEYIRRQIESEYGDRYDLYRDGLSIYTTLNLKAQKLAEKYLLEKLNSLQEKFDKMAAEEGPDFWAAVVDSSSGDSVVVRARTIQGALVAINLENGHIIAMVGGRDFKESQFNRAVQAYRQPGSAFKPFVYTVAVDNGYPPTYIIHDAPITLEMPDGTLWTPENYDKTFLGPMTLRDGLKKSRNLMAVRLIMKIHPEEVIRYAKAMGVKSSLSPVFSLALGSCEVSLLNITSAYGVFANGGIRIEPISILRIVDRDGNTVMERSRGAETEVLSAETAAVMTSMLSSVLEEGGTGYAARKWYKFERPAAGKTGTTGNFADAWFIGFTPQIVAGVWVGFDEKISMGNKMAGSVVALPIWANFMRAVHDSLGLPVKDFKLPPGLVKLEICSESHKIATEYCPSTYVEVFKRGTEPTEKCDIHHPGKAVYEKGEGNVIFTVPREPSPKRGKLRF